MRTRRIMLIACAAVLAALVAGCGEIKNTVTPEPGTSTHVTLELAGPPSALYAGVYDAIALGYYKQSDMTVRILTPKPGQNPLTLLHDYRATVAVSSEPDVLLRRNENVPVVSVGAIVQVPLSSVKIKTAKRSKHKSRKQHGKTKTSKSGHGKGSSSTGKSSTTAQTKSSNWTPGTVGTAGRTINSNLTVPQNARAALASSSVPTYQGLVFVARKPMIVSHNTSPTLRRFLQTAARGYRAARRDPQQAVSNMIKEVPSLAGQRKTLLTDLRAFLPYMFPAVPTEGKEKGKPQPWGFSDVSEWNQFGEWLHRQKLLSNPNAILDASTNNLLAGKGI